MNILTRWHRLREAARNGRLALAVNPTDALGPSEWPERDFDRTLFNDALDRVDQVPRFVVDPEVMRMIPTDHAMASVADMAFCGVLTLPLPECVVEFASGETTYSVLLQEPDATAKAKGFACVALPFASYHEDGHDHALAFPCGLGMAVRMGRPGDVEDGAMPEDPVFEFDAFFPDYVADDDVTWKWVEDVAPLAQNRCVLAFMASVLLTDTFGLVRERREVKASFNKARVARGRAPVPTYTRISVGSYRDVAGVERGRAEGQGFEVFLRRAHKRRVVVGAGRLGRRWTIFPAQVVGYLPDGRKPTVPEMLAARAVKPYLVKP